MVALLLTLFALGTIGGFFSGLVGLGGGIVMVPLLLYVPSFLGVASLDMKIIAGMTMMQSLGGSFSALVVHRKNRFVHVPLVLYMGGAGVTGALIGSIWSKHLTSEFMLALFAAVAIVASGLLLLPHTKNGDETGTASVNFSATKAVALGAGVGIIGGIIGQGGAFIIIPLMLYALRIPTRVALGSSVAISFMSALAGFIGKWGTQQVPLLLALVLTAGAVIGAQLGGRMSPKLKTTTLRTVLAALIAATAMRISFSFLSHLGISPTAIDVSTLLVFVLMLYAIVAAHKRAANLQVSKSREAANSATAALQKTKELLKHFRQTG